MIKALPSREAKLYLYSSVVLPLKQLNVSFPSIASPFRDKENGTAYYVELTREPMTENVRHNYQRDRQNRIRNWVVIMRQEGVYGGIPLAYYDKKRQWVKLYEHGFKKLGTPQMLGQFYELFDSHTPFTKVIIDNKRIEYMKMHNKLNSGLDIAGMPF